MWLSVHKLCFSVWLIIPMPSLSHELDIIVIITAPVHGFRTSAFITIEVGRKFKGMEGEN